MKVNRHVQIILSSLLVISVSYSQKNVDIISVLNKYGAEKSASFSFYMKNLTTGKDVLKINEGLSLIPASIFKLITTATILDTLGPDYKYYTLLKYTGDLSGNILNGNIAIEGFGDPVLGSARFEAHPGDTSVTIRWAKKLKVHNINSFNGDIYAFSSFFASDKFPATWTWEDIGNYYGAPARGLSYFDNSYQIDFQSGPNDGDETIINGTTPEVKGLTFVNEVKSSWKNKDLAYIYGGPKSQIRTLTGSIPLGRSSYIVKGAAPNPSMLLINDLVRNMEKDSLQITKEPGVFQTKPANYDSGAYLSLDTVYSPPLIDIISYTNKKSMNLYAEHFLKHLGTFKEEEEDEIDGGLEFIKQYWQNRSMDLDGFFIYDGSGLSRYNSVSAQHIVHVLEYMYKSSKYFDEFKNSLSVNGTDGTLRSFGRGTSLSGKIYGKTGSLRRVRSMAGYLYNKNSQLIGFCFIMNNYNCNSSQIRKVYLEILQRIYFSG